MTDDQIIRSAIAILESRLVDTDGQISSPNDVQNYVTLKLAGRKSEVFGLLLLDNRHNVIEYRELFHGTIDGAAVYPREVVRTILDANAAAVVIFHNHPSGNVQPSDSDQRITARIRQATDIIDVRLLDHIVCGGADSFSFAEHGLL